MAKKKKELRDTAITIRLLPSTRKKLQKICKSENRSMTNWIENVIEDRYSEMSK